MSIKVEFYTKPAEELLTIATLPLAAPFYDWDYDTLGEIDSTHVRQFRDALRRKKYTGEYTEIDLDRISDILFYTREKVFAKVE